MAKIRIGIILLLGSLAMGLFLIYNRQGKVKMLNPCTPAQSQADFIGQQLNNFGVKFNGGPFFRGRQAKFTTSDGAVIIFDLKKDIKSQLTILQLILKKVTMENKRVRLIDLSITSPHVVFKNN